MIKIIIQINSETIWGPNLAPNLDPMFGNPDPPNGDGSVPIGEEEAKYILATIAPGLDPTFDNSNPSNGSRSVPITAKNIHKEAEYVLVTLSVAPKYQRGFQKLPKRSNDLARYKYLNEEVMTEPPLPVC